MEKLIDEHIIISDEAMKKCIEDSKNALSDFNENINRLCEELKGKGVKVEYKLDKYEMIESAEKVWQEDGECDRICEKCFLGCFSNWGSEKTDECKLPKKEDRAKEAIIFMSSLGVMPRLSKKQLEVIKLAKGLR